MNRDEAIRRIIWCLLHSANSPAEAVATAETLKQYLGNGHEGQITFTNLLRAAGLFAKDDDGYFMRYHNAGANANHSLLCPPQPNYLLTFPVPAEPRMRIAYSVFTGLLLKYLYQTYGAVPTEVGEGMACLVAGQPLPNSDSLWNEFKQSEFIARALCEGLEATLGAISGIGRIDVTETMADSALLNAFLAVLPRFGNKFQTQGGIRLDFYFTKDVDDWLAQYDGLGDISESLPDLWRQGWQVDSSPHDVAKKIAVRVVRDINRDQPLPMRTFSALWTGEGSGASRKQGVRDGLEKAEGEDARHAKSVDDAVFGLLSKLDTKRCGTRTLHQWVKSKLNEPQHSKWLDEAARAIRAALTSDVGSNPTTLDAESLFDSIVTEFQAQTVVPSLRKTVAGHNREVRSAIQQTVGLCIALRLAEALNQDAPVSIFDWRIETLRRVPPTQEWALRFLKKCKPAGGKRIIEVQQFGNVERLAVGKSEAHRAPFQGFALNDGLSPVTSEPLMSGQRCIVCGSPLDLMAGAKSFLPEAKKRHYEVPTRNEAPSLCSNCAFIAYLSSIYPSSDLSIVEFPADNFLELFALYESLQGISALAALKYINRVASLSVLPSRYLLLSHRDGKGRMDGKAQVCLQLREQAHLLKHIRNHSIRVQIEGSIPHMWSEIQPHIPIGLSYFKELPSYYETQDSARKGFAYAMIRALQAGQPYKAFYVAVKYADDDGHPFERRVFIKNLKSYESFIFEHCQVLAKSLGGETVSGDIYQDIKEFSDYLVDLLHPLVQREARGGTSISGIARKYTDLVLREFGEGMAGKFIYAVCQEADSAERDGSGWVKHKTFIKLYGGSPDTKGKAAKEIAQAWDAFRKSHPVQLEEELRKYYCKHNNHYAIWQKFLREVQARTLALLMLNVRKFV